MPAWKPGDPPPPWSGNNEAMRDWMFDQLENFYRTYRADKKELIELIDPAEADILELFDSGNASEHEHGLKRLNELASERLGPEIAARIQWKRIKAHRPKAKPPHLLRPPPEKIWTYSRPVRIYMAQKAVKIIQDIWRKHYEGKWQRRSGDIDAYTIAAKYFDVDEEAVRAKPSGRHKPKT
jgi:hypothetical protein